MVCSPPKISLGNSPKSTIHSKIVQNSQRNANRKDIDNLSDSEIEQVIDDHIILDQKGLDIKKKYHGEFKKVLSNKKIAKLYHSEDQFKRELLKRIKGEKGKRTDYKRK